MATRSVPLAQDQFLDLAVMTAVIAIASKFVLRVRGKHVFNPTNFALVAMILLTGGVWVSPGSTRRLRSCSSVSAARGPITLSRVARGVIRY